VRVADAAPLVEAFDRRGRPRSHAVGHAFKGKRRPTHEKPDASKSSKHANARLRTRGRPACELSHIGGCLGHSDTHHVDGDVWNNEPGNLMRLCRSHHRLVDHGRIDLSAPVMPAFRVDGAGKRRYS